MMSKLIFLPFLFLFTSGVFGYFTLPGNCPENVQLQTEFTLADFFGKWYQVYHYSSDGQQLNNCSVLELSFSYVGIHLNQSRVDRGLFHRYSLGRLELSTNIEDAAKLDVTYYFNDQPRRLATRKYPFRVLRTDYKNYASVYTCEYSPAINKHFSKLFLHKIEKRKIKSGVPSNFSKQINENNAMAYRLTSAFIN